MISRTGSDENIGEKVANVNRLNEEVGDKYAHLAMRDCLRILSI